MGFSSLNICVFLGLYAMFMKWHIIIWLKFEVFNHDSNVY